MATKKTTAVATREAKTPQAKLGDLTDANLKRFSKYINITKDFALIPQGGSKLVEPTRDLAMKIIAFFNLSYDMELLEVKGVKKRSSKSSRTYTQYTMKATVTAPDGATASGHGIASTEQSYTEGREEHDAMARAETRALKRAIEGRVGLPMINQLIMHFFGGYTVGPKKMKDLGLM